VGTHGTTFLGDYAGMATFGNNFVPYFVQAGNPADPSDVYSTTLSPQP
jgi:hypothetical protein